MLTESLETDTQTIIQRISTAVHENNLDELKELSTEYQQQEFSSAAKELHEQEFNKLLIVAARKSVNEIALQLIELGADVNQFITFEVVAAERNAPITIMIDDVICRYKAKAHTTKAKTVDCYFLDALILLGNWALAEAIGVEKFDLTIYQVSNDEHINLLNLKINRERYTRVPLRRCCSDNKVARKKFESEVVYRLMWCSFFCNWLVKNQAFQWLYILRDNYQGASSGTCNTHAIVRLYLQAMTNGIGSKRWLNWQYAVDRKLNLNLAIDASNLGMAQQLTFEFLYMFPKNDPTAQEVVAILQSYYSRYQYITGFLLYMAPVALYSLIFAIKELLNKSDDAGNYFLLAISSILLLYSGVETAKVLATITCSAATKGEIKCFGGPQITAFRMYTMRSLANIVQPEEPEQNRLVLELGKV